MTANGPDRAVQQFGPSRGCEYAAGPPRAPVRTDLSASDRGGEVVLFGDGSQRRQRLLLFATSEVRLEDYCGRSSAAQDVLLVRFWRWRRTASVRSRAAGAGTEIAYWHGPWGQVLRCAVTMTTESSNGSTEQFCRDRCYGTCLYRRCVAAALACARRQGRSRRSKRKAGSCFDDAQAEP